MALRFYFWEDAGDLSFFVDEECCAFNAHIFFTVHAFLFPDAEGFAELLVGIGEQVVGQIVFLFELFLFGRVISRNAKDDCAGFLDLFECVAEPARFQGSTRGVGFGIKEQDYELPGKILE